ncbi:hypothetical protein HZS_8118 [Henneguya salminicola]|nr:hypothetical protein HZS_8118 [Henneguya salminicola]
MSTPSNDINAINLESLYTGYQNYDEINTNMDIKHKNVYEEIDQCLSIIYVDSKYNDGVITSYEDINFINGSQN